MEAIGRYRVQRRIGAGAFSTVWLGTDDVLDVPVAVKVIAENWVEQADVCARFLDEARLLRRITDPRVIGVYDIGRLPDGRDYFVMDYADQGTVQDLCAGPVPAATALRLGAEIAEAAAVLHRHGVIHRDIKPANLLLSSDADAHGRPRVVVADLGMAKRLAEESGATMAVGTPAYMAPEQAHGAKGLDRRVDVYGVAAVTYVLLSGRKPFADETSIWDVAARTADRSAPAIAAELGLPQEVDTVLRAALSTDPEGRPATASDLAAQLRRLHGALDGAAPAGRASATTATTTAAAIARRTVPADREEPAPPAEEQPRPQSGLSPRGLAGIAFALTALLAVTTWLTLSLAFPA